MSYGIEWAPRAEAILNGLDPWLTSLVLDGADRLSVAPTALSRAGGWPFYAQEQRYVFDIGGQRVTLFFRYSQDEENLYITDLSVLPAP